MKRVSFIKSLALLPLAGSIMSMKDLEKLAVENKRSATMPAMFVGHGSPMNAIADNDFTKSLAAMAGSLPQKPTAILVVSAHWLTRGTKVAITPKPETIYDFGGFPEALYRVTYPAPGSPEKAKETAQLVHAVKVEEDARWGLDHGAWAILRHMFPKADIPVFQMSIDAYQPAAYHYQLANELRALRNRGVLIIGSGNIVHNLRQIDFSEKAAPFAWAQEFDHVVQTLLNKRDDASLVNYEALGSAAQLSVPSNDHYLPMLYTLGVTEKKEQLQYTFSGIQHGSISMRCFVIGA